MFAAKEVFKERDIEIGSGSDGTASAGLPSQFDKGYFITAELRITDPNRVEETKARFKELCAITREEAGCTLFELHEFEEEPTKLMLWERFDSEEAFHFHHNAPYTIALKDKGLTEIVSIHQSDMV
nr:antibiotic biosynthesis monooxygenase [Marinomonas mediterranea]